MKKTNQTNAIGSGNSILRIAGLVLLVVLLWRVDMHEVLRVVRSAHVPLLVLSLSMIVPLIFTKTVRWRGILHAQGISFAIGPAFLAYFGSLFIGFLTPGRLGEFVKAVHVSQDCGVSSAQAFSSVLADRLFDLYMLLLVGGAAFFSLALAGGGATSRYVLACVVSTLLLTVPMVLFLNNTTFGWFQRMGMRFGALGHKLFAPDGWLATMRSGMCQLTWRWILLASVLTVVAYAIFFGQCYLLALALDIEAGFVRVTYAVALGSLVTLLPISISGLGTREATMIAYLGIVGVPAAQSLGFSLLVFATFYMGGGMIGALAWMLKPVALTGMLRKT